MKNYKYTLFSFFIMCLILVIYAVSSDILPPYKYDSWWYYTIATIDIVSGEKFTLLKYPDTCRGCLFPISLYYFQKILPDVWGWRVPSILMVASMFSLLLPLLIYDRKINTKKELLISIAALCIFIFVWGDFIQYPLSDFVALFYFILAVVIIKNIEWSSDSSLKIILMCLVSGAAFYISYNTRALYIYGIIGVIIFYLFNIRNKKYIIAILIGMLMMSIPQAIVNNKYIDTYTPRVLTERIQYPGKNIKNDLKNLQLYWGLQYDRYETYIGDASIYQSAGVKYFDKNGIKIESLEGWDENNFSVESIFLLMRKYPMDMLGIYTRHAISLLTPVYNKVYITDMYANKVLLINISILIWLILGINFYNLYAKKNINYKKAYITLMICSPAIFQLPGAPELRFFLPAYVLAYYYVVTIDYKKMWNDYKGYRVQVLTICGIIYLLWISIITDILSANELTTFIIHDSIK